MVLNISEIIKLIKLNLINLIMIELKIKERVYIFNYNIKLSISKIMVTLC